ncbi:MAG: hypothetical protein QF680_00930 [Acidobacteriota bacterium]|jgi:hypothetical protein|nr:hypothetical protein [Acidobacteriota bacterium]
MIVFRVSNLACVSLVVLVTVLVISPLSYAQQKGPVTDSGERMRLYDDYVEMIEESSFSNLPWQFVGPTNVSGRMTDVAVVEPRGENYTVYVAGASGGVWKTTNEGTTWEPIFDHAASTSIGEVTVAPSNPDIVWVGTGEANIFRSSMAGSGVYKSIDAGETWVHMGLAATLTIPRIIVHPTNPNIVYVAASGNEWTDNPERGVYKTTDGGETWEKILYISERTGAIDLVMDPSDDDTLYATTWQRVREKWNDPRNEPFYDESGIYRTNDGGASWNPINNGLPEGRHRGRIGIDIARSNPNVLYAFVDNYEIGNEAPPDATDAYGRPRGGVIKGATVYRTDDKGNEWYQVSPNDAYMERASGTYGWVFGQLRVDPNDENTVYFMGLGLNVSNDGGRTYRPLRGMHGDHHGLWIDPNNSNYLVNVNDGGVDFSYDAGVTWKAFNDNLPLVQFFNIGIDMDDPFYIYGSIQDHGSRRGMVDLSRGRDRIPAVAFESAPGGEGSSHVIDPTDPNIVYSAGFYGTISRTDLSTGERVSIVPEAAEGEPPLRGQWVAPFIISPHNPRIIYHGMNFLYRSMNRGENFEKISPDLTYNELDRIGDIPYQTIYTISESPFRFGLIYVGTDDGRVWMTPDGGETWNELTGNLPPRKFISRIVASAFDEGTVYMTQNGKRDDDFAAYVWKSTDYGQTWEDISANIPLGPVNVIREDPNNPRILYVGTDLGVHVSVSGGEYWEALANGLPSTFVSDMQIHPREQIAVISTHGRGMWAIDVKDISAITADVQASPLHLFDVDPVVLPGGGSGRGRGGSGFGGGGEASHASINYYLQSAQSVDIVINDAAGNVVRRLLGSGDAGLNSVVWNLDREGVSGVGGGRGGRGGRGSGAPRVPPGNYTVVITSGGNTATGAIGVQR